MFMSRPPCHLTPALIIPKPCHKMLGVFVGCYITISSGTSTESLMLWHTYVVRFMSWCSLCLELILLHFQHSYLCFRGGIILIFYLSYSNVLIWTNCLIILVSQFHLKIISKQLLITFREAFMFNNIVVTENKSVYFHLLFCILKTFFLFICMHFP